MPTSFWLFDDGEGFEDDGPVRLEGVALAVVDGRGPAGRVLTYGSSFDVPQLVIVDDHELRLCGSAVWATATLVVYPFRPTRSLVLASSTRLMLSVTPSTQVTLPICLVA